MTQDYLECLSDNFAVEWPKCSHADFIDISAWQFFPQLDCSISIKFYYSLLLSYVLPCMMILR